MMRVHEAWDTLLKAARDGRLASAFKEMRQAGLKVENDCEQWSSVNQSDTSEIVQDIFRQKLAWNL